MEGDVLKGSEIEVARMDLLLNLIEENAYYQALDWLEAIGECGFYEEKAIVVINKMEGRRGISM